MYRAADKLLEQLKKLIRREFNRLGIFGFDELNEDLIAEKLHADFPIAWKSTEEWDKEWSNDRQWS